jgi:hypothetical protein
MLIACGCCSTKPIRKKPMTTEFVIQHHTGIEERLDREELIAGLADDLRNDLQDEIDDQVSDFEARLYALSDDKLASEYRERTGETVRIEESEDE